MEVRIRPWDEGDAEALAAAVAASLPELRPWMPWAADEPQPPDARRAWIREANAAEAAGGDRTRAILAGGAVAGSCGLHRRIGPDALELGYWVATALTGRGVATAAVALLAAEAFADSAIGHVEIHHDPRNAASGAVAARAGFTPVAPVATAGAAPERIWRLTRAGWDALTAGR
ncbi:GNAT family N-acetyltransferase [Conexibacter woesei]|uniref:GNAT family N-acetyltransferase n=1 Tax=Conexibacter woesei TaxID=191495 RepID=UPI00040BBA0D|nr:GNAT family N-acetyltransferase [Conexibacter woesei]